MTNARLDEMLATECVRCRLHPTLGADANQRGRYNAGRGWPAIQVILSGVGSNAVGCFLSLAVAGLGFIWVVIDDEKQSWHDKIAGTTVVRVPKGVTLV